MPSRALMNDWPIAAGQMRNPPPPPPLEPLTVYLEDTFTSPSNVEITARAPEVGGWAKTAASAWQETINIDAATSRATGASTGTAYYLSNADIPSANYQVDAIFKINATGGTVAYGVQLRGLPASGDRSGYFLALYQEQFRLYRPNTVGSATLIGNGTAGITATNAGAVIWVRARVQNNASGNPEISAWVNGEQVLWSGTNQIFEDTAAEKITRAGRPAIRFSNRLMEPIYFRCSAIEDDPITFTSPAKEQFVQRNANGTGTLQIAGTTEYETGGFRARVLDDFTKEVVVHTVDVPAIGRTFSTAIITPRCGSFQLEMKANNDPSRTYRRRFTVGMGVALLGQSNVERLFHSTGQGSGVAPISRILDDGAYGAGWRQITNVAGVRMLAERLEATYGIPVGFYAFAESGTTIEQWTAPSGDTWQAFISPTNGIFQPGSTRSFEKVIWQQGENNSSDVSTYAAFMAKTRAVFDQIAEINTRQTPAKFFVAEIGHQISSGSLFTNTIRQTERDLPNVDSRVSFGPAFWAISMSDNVHASPNDAGYGLAARRWAQALAYADGLVPNGVIGPTATAITATAGGNVIRLPVIHSGGTTLKDNTGSTSGTGLEARFKARVAGSARTPTVVTLGANFVDVTVDGAAFTSGQTVELAYLEGPQPGYTPVIVDDQTPQGSTVGMPLRPTYGGYLSTTAS